MNHKGNKGNEGPRDATAAHAPIPAEDEKLAKQVIDAAFRVHNKLGPGLIESVYEQCIGVELARAGVSYHVQAQLPIQYDDVVIDSGLRLDLMVGERVVVELKAVDEIAPIHLAQLFTYLKVADRRLGLLIDFNVRFLKDGIKRVVR